MPTKQDFRMLIQEVCETCRSEINLLRSDLHHLSTRVTSLEEEGGDIKHKIFQIHSQLASQASTLRDFHCHLEDLDNRGRRNNIRVYLLPYKPSSTESLVAVNTKRLSWTGLTMPFGLTGQGLDLRM